MKIKRVSCEQFAGITDLDKPFADGMNIVIGENEAGKSTMVDLIYQVLFKNAKINKKSDGEFILKYFPHLSDDTPIGRIDGEVEIDTPEGVVILSKVWDEKNKKHEARLKVGDKPWSYDEDFISEKLKELLGYSEGLYNEVVFASQKRISRAVETLLSETGNKDTRDSLSKPLKKVIANAGGVDIDKLSQKIQEKIDELIGRWDVSIMRPEKNRGIDNPWQNGVGLILAAYYEMERSRKILDDAKQAEDELDKINSQISDAQKSYAAADKALTEFLGISGKLERRNSLNKDKNDTEAKLKNAQDDQQKWPEILRNLENAMSLSKQLSDAQVKALYDKCHSLKQNADNAQKALEALQEVLQADVDTLESSENKKASLENQLKGMNIAAKIRKLGDAPITVRSAITGEVIDILDGYTSINEAVIISIPGIMEMEIAPQDVNVNAVQADIANLSKTISEICTKYGVDNYEELCTKQREYNKAANDHENAQKDLKRELGEFTWEQIESQYATLPDDVRTVDEVQFDIKILCDNDSLERFTGGKSAEVKALEGKYTNQVALADRIGELEKTFDEIKKELSNLGEIPSEYEDVDPEVYKATLQNEKEKCESAWEAFRGERDEIMRRQSEYSSENLRPEYEAKKAEFERRKGEYDHWINIQKAFNVAKSKMDDAYDDDVEIRFAKYLSMISGGRLELSSKIDEKLSATVNSNNNRLTYDTLSAGTLDTISLAFRLAMLEHIFPDGGGLAVFDDPFTEMSPDRTAQACKLLNEFASHGHQVIFITCDGKYKSMLPGNVIEMG